MIPRRPRPLPVRLLLCAALALVAGCGDDEPAATPDTPSADAPHRAPADAGPRVLGRVPTFALTTQDGKPFPSDTLWGKVWIGNFFFTRCNTTCPIQTARLVELQKAFAGDAALRDVHFVSISVDADHDTPAVMSAYAAKNGGDLSTWTLLTGDRREIWAISSLGFMLPTGDDPTNADMPISHSAHFILVDRVGRIRGFFDSQTDDGIARLKEALAEVAAEEPVERVDEPDGLAVPPGLAERRDAQLAAARSYGVLHDFSFADRRWQSEIEFVNRVTDDGARTYKPVHYDHGNGVAVADVDGDGLYDLYFTNQVGSNQLWRNKGDGKFEDITDDAGVAVRDVIGVTASFADVDNDGDPDLFVTTVKGGNHLFLNDGEGAFEDVTEKAGVAYTGHSSTPVFFDYDKDGLLDLFLCNVGVYTTGKKLPVVNDSTTAGLESGTFEYYEGLSDGFSGHLKRDRDEKSILYRNLGKGRFKDVTQETLLSDISWTGDASPVDVNEDGWPDLYVLNMQGNDEYYENLGGKAFLKKSREVFPRTPWGSMGIKVFDFDNDGRLDIYITDMHSDMSENVGIEREKLKSRMQWPPALVGDGTQSIWGNAFFRKAGKDRYEEVSDALGAENYWPWGLSVGDLNADGFDDAFVASSMNYPFRYGINSVLLNDRGRKFLDSEFVLGVEPRRGPLAKPWFDLDCSSSRDAGRKACQGADGRRVVWGALGSRSSVLFDLDGDGDLDIVTNDFNSEPLVLVSDLAQRHAIRWLQVRLVGAKSNRSGIGALVRVHAAGQTQVKVNDGKSGYLSQSDLPLYFGLGAAEKIDWVEVTWPSGAVQRLDEGLNPNETLVIGEE